MFFFVYTPETDFSLNFLYICILCLVSASDVVHVATALIESVNRTQVSQEIWDHRECFHRAMESIRKYVFLTIIIIYILYLM